MTNFWYDFQSNFKPKVWTNLSIADLQYLVIMKLLLHSQTGLWLPELILKMRHSGYTVFKHPISGAIGQTQNFDNENSLFIRQS